MNRTRLRSAIALASLAVSASVSLPAVARTVPAIAGRAHHVSESVLFLETAGGVQNISPTSRSFLIPQVVDGPVNSIVVSAKGDDATQFVQCAHYVVDLAGNHKSGQYLSSSVHNGSGQQFTIQTLVVPAGGFGYIHCNVQPFAVLMGVSY